METELLGRVQTEKQLSRCILPVFCLALLAGCGSSGFSREDTKRIETIRASNMPDLEKGKELLRFVRPGLREEQVRAILGDPSIFHYYGPGYRLLLYTRYRAQVWFDNTGRVISSGGAFRSDESRPGTATTLRSGITRNN